MRGQEERRLPLRRMSVPERRLFAEGWVDTTMQRIKGSTNTRDVIPAAAQGPGLFGFYDPATGAFPPVQPPVTAPASGVQTASTVSRAGIFIFKITVNIASTYPWARSLTVQRASITAREVSITARAPQQTVTPSGNTAICNLRIPYLWPSANDVNADFPTCTCRPIIATSARICRRSSCHPTPRPRIFWLQCACSSRRARVGSREVAQTESGTFAVRRACALSCRRLLTSTPGVVVMPVSFSACTRESIERRAAFDAKYAPAGAPPNRDDFTPPADNGLDLGAGLAHKQAYTSVMKRERSALIVLLERSRRFLRWIIYARRPTGAEDDNHEQRGFRRNTRARALTWQSEAALLLTLPRSQPRSASAWPQAKASAQFAARKTCRAR